MLREGYTRSLFARDLGAGVIVGVLALPLALAFAIASGVKPEQGLFTAIIGGFLISALSGSRVQIGGPTGAFIVIVYSVVQRFGFSQVAKKLPSVNMLNVGGGDIASALVMRDLADEAVDGSPAAAPPPRGRRAPSRGG